MGIRVEIQGHIVPRNKKTPFNISIYLMNLN